MGRAIARHAIHPVAVVIGVVEDLSTGAHLLADVAARIMGEELHARCRYGKRVIKTRCVDLMVHCGQLLFTLATGSKVKSRLQFEQDRGTGQLVWIVRLELIVPVTRTPHRGQRILVINQNETGKPTPPTTSSGMKNDFVSNKNSHLEFKASRRAAISPAPKSAHKA